MARLGDYCIINPKLSSVADDTVVSFIPMQCVGEDGAVDYSNTRLFKDVKKGFTSFQDGDVLFAKITPCMENGKGAVVEKLCNAMGFGSTEFHVLRPDSSKIISKWVYYFTKWPFFRKECEKNMTGSAGQKRVPKSFLEKYELSAPSMETQRKQVSALEKLDQVIADSKMELVKLDDLVKSQFIELSKSAECQSVRMGDLATYINGYSFKPTDWSLKGRPIIRIQNLNNPTAAYNLFDGNLDPKYEISYGDILVSWATHLEAYVWRGPDAWLNQHIFKVIFDKTPVDKTYFVFATEEALREAFKNAHGFKPTMEHIKRSDFENAVVQMPDIKIQKSFAKFVQQADKSKFAIQQSLAQLETLKKSLMQEYFG